MVLTITNLKGGISHIACMCGGNDFSRRDAVNKSLPLPGVSQFICRNCGRELPADLTKKFLETYDVPAEKVITA